MACITLLPYILKHGEGGHIVNTSSSAAVLPGGSIYGACKSAVLSLSEGMANDLAKRQYRRHRADARAHQIEHPSIGAHAARQVQDETQDARREKRGEIARNLAALDGSQGMRRDRRPGDPRQPALCAHACRIQADGAKRAMRRSWMRFRRRSPTRRCGKTGIAGWRRSIPTRPSAADEHVMRITKSRTSTLTAAGASSRFSRSRLTRA